MCVWVEALLISKGPTLQDKFDNITIALAGIIQAISLAREIAQTTACQFPTAFLTHTLDRLI